MTAIVNTQARKKTPTILQMEAVECGAASLAMILAYHGKVVPLEELRDACGVSRNGVKASNMIKAARSYGLECKGFKTDPASLADYPTPMIVHWNFNHFLVLEGGNKTRVFLNDPAQGRRKLSKDEFDQSFTGVALTFKPGPDFVKGGKKRTIFQSLKSRFRDSSALAFVLMAGLLLVIPGLVAPIFGKIFVDNILIQNMDGWFKPLILGMAATALVRGALTFMQEHYLLRFRTKMAITESSRYLSWLLQVPVVFFSQRLAGDLAKRVGNNDLVADMLTGRLATAMLNMIAVAFYAALLFYFDPLLTLIGIAVALVNLVVLQAASRFRQDMSLKYMVEVSKLYGFGSTGLRLIETLKATGGETDFFEKWSGYHARSLNTRQRMGRVTYLTNIVPPFLTHLNTVAILIIGGYRVMNGDMTMGMLVAFQSLMNSFMMPFNRLVTLGAEYQEARGYMEQLDDVYRYRRDPELLREPDENAPPKLSGVIELKDIKFGYSALDKPLIEDFSLTMKPGTRVALVGRSGSGKSTISKLVSGLYEAWDGQILFDGKPRAKWPRETIVNSISVIDQEIALFEGSVRDNLTLWDNTVTDQQLIRAGRDAAIHDVISERSGGYDSQVEENGDNFSGGQKQRLEIARGLVNDPTILIMDEATSALDPRTEMMIDDQIRRRGCTCLIVAHRLSTIRDCDEIIVMDHGKIAQRGNHDQLANEPGIYQDLIKTM